MRREIKLVHPYARFASNEPGSNGPAVGTPGDGPMLTYV